MNLLWFATLLAYAIYAYGITSSDMIAEYLGRGLLITIIALSLTRIAHKMDGE